MPDSLPKLPPGLAALLARASVGPQRLTEPAPSDEALRLAVAAALRAPDHAGVKPWRFVAISGDDRAAFGDFLAEAMARFRPDFPPDRIEKERMRPSRAPLFIVAGASIRHGFKIPVWEQQASAAAGVMNFLNALDAQGFGAFWASSPGLENPEVKKALGFEEGDMLLGWIMVGTPTAERTRPMRPEPDAFLRRWTKP
ncbi:nitroreductase [Acetobacteraceae bacterium H6797]|nr:nitroreductase [Acetobacteraceae bacterium H6797]